MLTEQEYKTAREQLDANDQASEQWRKENKTNGIPKEIYEKFPFANVVTNDLRSEIEIFEFMRDKPKKYFLYVNESRQMASTWTGQYLGRVSFGREYRDNFGGKRQSVTIQAINGLTYFGTYYKSSGNYARITAKKLQHERK